MTRLLADGRICWSSKARSSNRTPLVRERNYLNEIERERERDRKRESVREREKEERESQRERERE